MEPVQKVSRSKPDVPEEMTVKHGKKKQEEQSIMVFLQKEFAELRKDMNEMKAELGAIKELLAGKGNDTK